MPCSEAEAKRYRMEVLKCRKSFAYFCDTYCQILSDGGQGGDWVPFRLWPEQRRVARLLQENRLVVVLKARQLGLTWLVLAFALWLLLFHPIATVLLFSRRDDEAVDLLAVRLRGMYDRLPAWLKAERLHRRQRPRVGAGQRLAGAGLPDHGRRQLHGDAGRRGRGRPVPRPRPADAGGQADHRRRRPHGAAEPGGQVASRRAPSSGSTRRPGRGRTDWAPVFLPWHARPDRDAAWYEAQRRDMLARTGAWTTCTSSTRPRTPRRWRRGRSTSASPPPWLQQCYRGAGAAGRPAARTRRRSPAWWSTPCRGRPAATSSAPTRRKATRPATTRRLAVLDVDTGEEVAALAGQVRAGGVRGATSTPSGALVQRGRRAGGAEQPRPRGPAVAAGPLRACGWLPGHDGKPGWLSSSKGKALLYDAAADAFREGRTVAALVRHVHAAGEHRGRDAAGAGGGGRTTGPTATRWPAGPWACGSTIHSRGRSSPPGLSGTWDRRPMARCRPSSPSGGSTWRGTGRRPATPGGDAGRSRRVGGGEAQSLLIDFWRAVSFGRPVGRGSAPPNGAGRDRA